MIVIGCPFPNIHDPVMKAKMDFLTSTGQSSSQFVENSTMRAVNQSIGRAIRHQNDFATIVLLDARYRTFRDKLPGWMHGGEVVEGSGAIDDCLKRVEGFFAIHARTIPALDRLSPQK